MVFLRTLWSEFQFRKENPNRQRKSVTNGNEQELKADETAQNSTEEKAIIKEETIYATNDAAADSTNINLSLLNQENKQFTSHSYFIKDEKQGLKGPGTLAVNIQLNILKRAKTEFGELYREFSSNFGRFSCSEINGKRQCTKSTNFSNKVRDLRKFKDEKKY